MSESNIINAQERFGAPERAAELHSKSLRQTRLRLDEADAIAHDLRSLARIPESDRPILARNLGRMIEAASGDEALSAISDLFHKTFGDHVAASALKKRKRYIRLSSEQVTATGEAGEYHARGAEFVRLAEACATLKPSRDLPVEDKRRQAILNLVEGSSFDTHARASLRRTEAGRVELMERLNGLLTRIEADVNLDSYFDLACDLPLTIMGSGKYIDPKSYRDNNEMLKRVGFEQPNALSSQHEGDHGPTGEGGDSLDGLHFLAPKIPLGFLYTPVELNDVIPFKLDSVEDPKLHEDGFVSYLMNLYGSEHLHIYEAEVHRFRQELARIDSTNMDDWIVFDEETETFCAADDLLDRKLHERLQSEHGLKQLTRKPSRADHIKRIKAKLVETYGSEAARIFDEAPSDSDESDWWAQWHRMTDDEDRVFLWFARPLFLTIYRERSTGRSRLAFATRRLWGDQYEEVIQRWPYSADDEDSAPWRVGEPDDNEVHAVIGLLGEGHLIWDPDSVAYEGRTEFDDKLLFVPNDDAMRLAYVPTRSKLDSSLGTMFVPLFDDCRTSFSPAPHNTIAGAILRNLAHAPIGERLDDLLLHDAREKVDAVRAFVSRETDTYRAGIQRLT